MLQHSDRHARTLDEPGSYYKPLGGATPRGEAPRFLIRGNDATYGPHVTVVATGSGMEMLRTPITPPRANAMCERLLRSIRRGCLDHILVVSETGLRSDLQAYVTYFNQPRPYQDINQRAPEAAADAEPSAGGTGNSSPFQSLVTSITRIGALRGRG